LRRLEQAHRSALADHVHRTARMGLCVMISECWYKAIEQRLLHHPRFAHHRESPRFAAKIEPAASHRGKRLFQRNRRTARLQRSPPERPKFAPKPPFLCERRLRFTARKLESPEPINRNHSVPHSTGSGATRSALSEGRFIHPSYGRRVAARTVAGAQEHPLTIEYRHAHFARVVFGNSTRRGQLAASNFAAKISVPHTAQLLRRLDFCALVQW
jgi:hypothetical protein